MRTHFGPWALLGAFCGGAALAAAVAPTGPGAPAATRLIRVPQSLDGVPSAPMTSGRGMTLVGPAPAAQRQVVFTNGTLLVGVAGYGTMELELKDYPSDEFMYFLDGAVDITDARGVTEHVKAGDAIVIPKGFNGRWTQRGPVRKIAVLDLSSAHDAPPSK